MIANICATSATTIVLLTVVLASHLAADTIFTYQGELREIVQYEENGVDAQGMDYSKLTPLLVESVKALAARNQLASDGCRSNVAKLNTEMETLRQRVSDLEKLVEQFGSLQKEKQQ